MNKNKIVFNNSILLVCANGVLFFFIFEHSYVKKKSYNPTRPKTIILLFRNKNKTRGGGTCRRILSVKKIDHLKLYASILYLLTSVFDNS